MVTCGAGAPDRGAATAIVGAILIDSVVLDAVPRSVVVVDPNGRIAAAGPMEAVRIPPGANVIEADELTLLPGLVDCHAHLAMRDDWSPWTRWPSQTDLVVDALEAGRRWVRHGVTTVRDAWGSTAGLRRAFASGEFLGPDLQISTGAIRSSAGDVTLGPAGLLFPSRHELPMGAADGVDGVRREVRLRIAAGADWIKVFTCGWNADDEPDRTRFTVEELRTVVEEARVAHLHGVMAHTQGPASIKLALAAGIRSIDHGDLIDDEAIALMKRCGAVLAVQGPLMPEPDDAGRLSGQGTRYWATQVARIRAAAEAGVRIVLGSDAFGDQLPHAVVAHLAACGLGSLGAVRAATIEGARLLGRAGETGSIEPGKRADLLLFRGDPLEHPEQWRDPTRIVLAMAGGRVMADRRAQATSTGMPPATAAESEQPMAH